MIPQTTNDQPILRLYHDAGGWGMATLSVDELLETGCIADPGDPEECASALERLVVDLEDRGESTPHECEGMYHFRTDRPQKVREQADAWQAHEMGL